MSFKERLKQARESKGLTQQEVADGISKKKNSISDWEVGKARPDVDVLARLCKLYKINVDSLFEEFDDTKLRHRELPLTADIKELIECYQSCSIEDKEELLLIARHKSKKKTDESKSA